jgi:subtilase-type serine protease
MQSNSFGAGFRRSLACATVSIAAVALSTAAHAQGQPTGSEESPIIVTRTDIIPNAPPPTGSLDNAVNITGVGQMAIRPDQTTTGLAVCTGTLINPRTVIFASHCVNDQAANSYGYATGGTSISFGFEFDNRPAVRQWLGLASVSGGTDANPALRNVTNLARHLYAVEQVWYDPRSLDLGPGLNFLQADIALATLDTPAFDIPTWALLFSPLTSETHATINGYGATGSSGTSGANLGVDFRRRSAENMISFLGSLDDRNNFLFGPDDPFFVQSLYQLDFDDPAGQAAFDPATGHFDFDLFDGAALPGEGTTAGGDSGGPLIVDQLYTRKVIAGVLSGGSRFFGPQPFSSYGTSSFYQPLFLYWDVIVANNPYKYATNIAGSRDWSNPAHWVQTMDPNYTIDRNGVLVNALPNSLGGALSTDTTKFGDVCFLDDCQNFDQTRPEAAGRDAGLVVPGGPGSKNFVPNNVTANPQAGINGRYYDVTLSAFGTTSVTTPIQIDRLTVDGATKLDVKSTGSLTVLGDFTQNVGFTNVDGLLKTGEALVSFGILSGSGKIDPTYLTIIAGAVLPGGIERTATLGVQGDLILSSASLLQIELSRNSSDKLAVTGDASNAGIASLDGTILFAKAGAAPRDGQSFEVITATGGVAGTFDNVLGAIGVLRPQLTYGANNVVATLKAGKLGNNLVGSSAAAQSFANALDQLRVGSYGALSGLYGAVDVMDSLALTTTLSNLTPRVAVEAVAMSREQNGIVRTLVADRLSMLGTGEAQTGSFAVLGAPETLGLATGQTSLSGSSASQLSFARRYAPAQARYGRLPEHVSGFISGGYESGARSFADGPSGASRSTWHMAMGLEMEAAPNVTLGTAFGVVNGRSNLTGSQAEARTNQAIGYGSYRLGGGAYLAGLASVSYSTIGLQRGVTTGIDSFSLNGTTRALSYDLHAETGINLDVAKGLTLTPRASLRYSADRISGYRERGSEVALLVDDLKDRRLETRLGAKLSGSTGLGSGWNLAPQLSADMVKTVSGGSTGVTVRFAEAAGIAFTLPAFSQDRSWTEVRGGLSLSNGPLSLGAAIQSDVGRSDYRDNRAVADVTLRF